MKLKPYIQWLTFLVILALSLAACQSTPSTPVPVQAQVNYETPQETTSPIPSVTVMDQELTNGTVTIKSVVSNGPGWLVVHAQADGKPGPILGYSPVVDGENMNVTIDIDQSKSTETLFAMLHTDAGVTGTFEFPDGPDAPVKVDGQIVTPDFKVSGLPMAEQEITPSVSVADQDIVDGTVTIAEVISNGPGWLVVHAQADGKPGPILGFASVEDGTNTNVVVPIDGTSATETLYAMLHTDAGELGTFEFPNGSDVPVKVNDQVVTPPFQVKLADSVKTDTVKVEIADSSFSPSDLTISLGTTVVWTNMGSLSHTVTADNNAFDSGTLPSGDTFEFTFTEAGSFPYHCQFHGGPDGEGMSGVITVTEN